MLKAEKNLMNFIGDIIDEILSDVDQEYHEEVLNFMYDRLGKEGFSVFNRYLLLWKQQSVEYKRTEEANMSLNAQLNIVHGERGGFR